MRLELRHYLLQTFYFLYVFWEPEPPRKNRTIEKRKSSSSYQQIPHFSFTPPRPRLKHVVVYLSAAFSSTSPHEFRRWVKKTHSWFLHVVEASSRCRVSTWCLDVFLRFFVSHWSLSSPFCSRRSSLSRFLIWSSDFTRIKFMDCFDWRSRRFDSLRLDSSFYSDDFPRAESSSRLRLMTSDCSFFCVSCFLTFREINSPIKLCFDPSSRDFDS